MTAPLESDVPPAPAPKPFVPRVVPRPEGAAGGLKKLLGVLGVVAGSPLIVFGLLGLMVGVVKIFSPDEGKKASDGVLILLLAGVFIGVGRFLWKKGMAPFREARRRELLFGLIRAQSRIPTSDVAELLKVSEPEARELLATIVARHEADLVFLWATREYVHRVVLVRAHGVARNCPTCDAPVGAMSVLPGDKLECAYCQTTFLVA
ncbi:hypothetical protein LXT21_28365 [Myxococcus sp. K38C18041901]|uniref:hypothetical protein n=1 Tax=Myxococcus guangdongensis TaxID=2906760 RepID=UPI0020A82D89|nr:hypothetical protein [Myxococcus guangdongensis]MCP3062705.1 hypothetical protein [Myxococcus guangdongensis]